MTKPRVGVLLCALGVFALGAAPRPILAGEKGPQTESARRHDPGRGKLNFWSPEREMALGRRLAAELELTTRLLDDPVVNPYVIEVAERIVRHSEVRMPIEVRVIDSAEVDAFTLPGGFLYITAGLVRETQSEAELAGVMAHEVAHVAARHATRQMTRSELLNWATLPLLFFGGPVAYALRQGAALAVPLCYLKFSRDAEREADTLGLEYMEASGYDPAATIEFFERVKAKEKDPHAGIAKVFSTHPMTRDRIAAAQRTMERFPEREEYVLTTSHYDQVRVYLEHLLGERTAGRSGPVLRRRTESRVPLLPPPGN